MTYGSSLGLLSLAAPTLLFLHLLWRREWEWTGLYVALSFGISASANFHALLADLWELYAPNRKPMDAAIIGSLLYSGGMIGAMRAPTSFRTFFVALAAMETLFVGVIPIYRFAFDLDQGAYFAINGQDVSNGMGFAATLLLAIIPMMIGVPWLLARQSSSEKTIIAPALSRYGMLSGMGVVAFMVVSTCFVAWGYIGRGPFSGEPQRPAFEMAQSMVSPNMVFGLLMGCIIYLFWSFPKRFFDPVVNLLEESQHIESSSLEDIAHPLWRGVARNLDERRHEAQESQKQLNQMRSLLLSFMDTSPADMFVKTVTGKLVYCSPNLAAAVGRTQAEMSGMNESEYHSAEHLERLRKIDAKLLRDKKPLVTEVYNAALDRHELQTRFPIYNDAGEITHIGGMFFDIDDRVKARQQQKRAEEWLASFVKNAPSPMILADPANNKYLLANSVAAEFYDMTAEELVASDPADAQQYWPRWNEDMAPAMRKALVDREPQTVETIIQRKREGTVANYLVSLFPLIDDACEMPLLASVGVDITAIRQAERALAEREAQLTALFEHVPADIAVFDKNHRVVMVNKITAQGLGESASAFRGKHPGEYAEHWENFETVFATGVKVQNTGKPERFTSRFTPPGKDRQIVYDTMFFPIKSASGEVEQVGLFLFDITKQAEAEKALVEQTSHIHQSEKLAALGQLLAGVAHELNNPLAIVMGRAAMLNDKLTGTPHEDSIQRLRSAAERCARIVKTFITMARQTGPQRTLVQIPDLIDAALDMTGHGLRSAGIALSQDIAPDLPDLTADGDQLIQVLINLIINAQHALEGASGDPKLHIAARYDGARQQVIVEVTDNGPGVSPKDAARIFEPFFTTKDVGSGTGLGLSVCRSMIEAHDGTLVLAETPGGGATFRISLPLGNPVSEEAKSTTKPASIGRRHVLIVDDEPEVAEVLAEMLGEMGLDCTIAGSGKAALQLLAAETFDAIFSDVRMPRMDGPAFLAALQEMHPGMVERLIFATGDVLHAQVEGLRSAGRPIVEKPYDPQLVRNAVTALFAQGEVE